MSLDYVEYPEAATIEFMVVGEVTKDDYEAVLGPMQAFLETHTDVRVIEIIKSAAGFDPAILVPGVCFDIRNLSHISQVAVVSDVGWISPVVRAAGGLSSTRLRLFSGDALETARDWAMPARHTVAAE